MKLTSGAANARAQVAKIIIRPQRSYIPFDGCRILEVKPLIDAIRKRTEAAALASKVK